MNEYGGVMSGQGEDHALDFVENELLSGACVT
jgi:hypothetical protein